MTDRRCDRRWRWAGTVTGLLGAIVLGAGLATGAAPERKTLDVHTARDAQLASQLVLGQAKGFFREQGVDGVRALGREGLPRQARFQGRLTGRALVRDAQRDLFR